MGTRNLTMVIYKNKVRVAQYGQWDGYPEGQGLTILEFLKSLNNNYIPFKKAVELCRFVDEDERQAYFKEIGVGETQDYLNETQVAKYRSRFPLFHRNIGGKILERVLKASKEIMENPEEFDPNILLQDESEFAGDSLFCEWCYVVDLDSRTFEVYQGYNKSPLKNDERFKYLEKIQYEKELERQRNIAQRTGEDFQESKFALTYYPVKLSQVFPLDCLPSTDFFVTLMRHKDNLNHKCEYPEDFQEYIKELEQKELELNDVMSKVDTEDEDIERKLYEKLKEKYESGS